MESARVLAPAGGPGYNPQQQQQPAPAATAPRQPAPAPGGGTPIAPAPGGAPTGLEGYDMSSLDQLQAHALQLSASAGLTNLLLPNGQPIHQPQAGQPAANGQQPPGQLQQPFLFLQPAGANGAQQLVSYGAPPAAAPPGDGTSAPPGSAAAPPQGFALAGGPPAAGAPANLGQQLFAAASQGAGTTLTLAPNGTLQPSQQSYSTAGIPIPMPMMIPQQQQAGQAAQQQQLQPLQPAPPSLSASLGGAPGAAASLAGSKRNHDSSVVSMGSNASLNLGGGGVSLPGMPMSLLNGSTNASMDMSDYPEFQLRNKDGSVITEKDLEKMSPAERRRYERNLREQQRSFRISQQIQQLRDVLSESKVPFKPNKYSILVSVADYIKQLQTRAIMLDSEHQKLFKTIQETNEMVASGQIPDPNTPSAGSGDATQTAATEGDGTFVQGLDYQAVFDQTPTANGVASIDGRILACNKELENILNCPRDQIERQSLFTLVQNHQEIFEAMAELLKRADALSNGSLKADPVQLLYWSGRVVTPGEKKVCCHTL